MMIDVRQNVRHWKRFGTEIWIGDRNVLVCNCAHEQDAMLIEAMVRILVAELETEAKDENE